VAAKAFQSKVTPGANARKAMKLAVVAGWFGTRCRAQWTCGAQCPSTIKATCVILSCILHKVLK